MGWWVDTWDYSVRKESYQRYKRKFHMIYMVTEDGIVRARNKAKRWGLRLIVRRGYVSFGEFDSFEEALLFADQFNTYNIRRVM